MHHTIILCITIGDAEARTGEAAQICNIINHYALGLR